VGTELSGWKIFAASCPLITLLIASPCLNAQRYEIGAQVTGLHLHKIDEAPVGIGGRFHYKFARFVASDFELTHYPENSAGNFGETSSLLGIRAGKGFGLFGAFVKARLGVIHFGGQYDANRLDHKTHLQADLGGMLEFYPTSQTFLRIEAGDTVIYFGSAKLFNRPNPDALGTVHNFQPSVGFGFRF
jgi:hypothetical protein